MTALEELQQELEMSLLGEDWQKTQKEKAEKHKYGPRDYLKGKEDAHTALSVFHKGAAHVQYGSPKMAIRHNLKGSRHHNRQSARHAALADAYGRLSRSYRSRHED